MKPTTNPTKRGLGDAKIFPLADAQLAVDLAAARSQLGLLCDRARRLGRDEVCTQLTNALSALADAVHASLVVDK